ncbi:hypothetical protein D5F01_LYC23883 [Larimichthys crocea]|uniref:Uncharacterized protein n=1 Tax=Larimichthys crocea TaxID=215358 RepID=A0A6G0HFQ2_LARCR|nr:hypothetical protein D5F01_LYC23883 [Larimichthys crocea]
MSRNKKEKKQALVMQSQNPPQQNQIQPDQIQLQAAQPQQQQELLTFILEAVRGQSPAWRGRGRGNLGRGNMRVIVSSQAEHQKKKRYSWEMKMGTIQRSRLTMLWMLMLSVLMFLMALGLISQLMGKKKDSEKLTYSMPQRGQTPQRKFHQRFQRNVMHLQEYSEVPDKGERMFKRS